MIEPKDIKAARKATQKTQLQMAVEVGVSYQTYRLWEGGGTRPGPENEKKLRAALCLQEETNAVRNQK